MATNAERMIWPTLTLAVLIMCASGIALAKKLPQKDDFLKSVQEASPIVIKDCIVKGVSADSRKDIESNATKYSGKREPLTSEELVKNAVLYYGSSCFADLEIDEEIYPEDPWRTPASFVQALSTNRFKGYAGLDGIQTLAAHFNQHQDCLFGRINPCRKNSQTLSYAPSGKESLKDYPDNIRQKGHSSINAKQEGSYIQITADVVVKGHTDPIDDGMDRYKTFYLHNDTFNLVADLDGRAELAGPPSLVFQFKEAKNDCLGLQDGRALNVFDLHSQSVVWEGTLPDGTNAVSPGRTVSKKRIQFTVDGEEHVSNEKMEATCELPYWSRFFTYAYTVTCHGHGGQCRVRKTLVRQHHACSNIGGCD